MADLTANVVICGAGLAGVSAVYHLSVKHGVKNIILVDERPPLSLTSDKSTECYRNWWPGPGDDVVAYMNRSIDIMEELARESGNVFQLNRRGYLFVTANPARLADFRQAAEEAASLGSGPVRYHTGRPDDPPYQPAPAQGFEGQPIGSDLITDRALIRQHFPYLAQNTVAVLHARRCGWLSAQQLGMYMLERARQHGVRLIHARVEGVEVRDGQVQAVRLGDGASIPADRFVIAAGPFLKEVGRMVGVDLPVYCELHAKIAFNDHLRAVPRHGPLMIWTDPQTLSWSDEECALLAESDTMQWLLKELPSGPHCRPEGGADSPVALTLWTYDNTPVEPVVPPTFDPFHHEIVLRGVAAMIPALRGYFQRTPKPIIDGGYYCKTTENRPLIGPLPVKGAYVVAAFSGFGIMASCAGGDLLAAHLTGSPLPHYAPAFLLERYQDPAYQKLLANWGATGQL